MHVREALKIHFLKDFCSDLPSWPNHTTEKWGERREGGLTEWLTDYVMAVDSELSWMKMSIARSKHSREIQKKRTKTELKMHFQPSYNNEEKCVNHIPTRIFPGIKSQMLTVRLRGPSPYGQPRCTCPDLFDFQFKRGKDKRTECLILLNTRFWELLCDFQWGCWPIWIIAPIESFRMLKKRPRKVRWPGKPLKSIPSQCVQYKLKTHGTLVEYLPNQAQYDDGRYFKIRPSCLLNSSIMDPGWILYYIII